MRFIILFIYIISNVYFFVMNYEMFTITDYINYGNGTFYFSPILFVEFIGLIFIIMFFILDSEKEKSKKKMTQNFESIISNLKKEIEILNVRLENKELKKENELLSELENNQ